MVNRYFTIANLLLATAGVYFGVSIFYAVLIASLDSGPPPVPTAGRALSVGPESPGGVADYQAIVDRNLFNTGKKPLAESGKGAAGIDVDKLKQTGLKLKLWGTGIGPDGQTYAVIEDPKTREQFLYRPGDTVQKAAVKMVLRQKVVLNVDGRDEVLIMEEPGIIRAAAPGPAATAEAAPAPRLAAEPGEQVALTGEQVEKAMEDIGDLLSQATFRPYIEDGRPAGISITGIKPNAIFRKLRLRNGDVITGVNNQAITSVDDAMKVFGTLSADGPIQVQVKRRGREETLEYKID
jgi:general secretion pathway protein C